MGEERGKLEKSEWEREREGGGMAASQTRLSDTAHQSSVRPADRYFQHEMTHQLYRRGVGERHTEARKWEREKERIKAFLSAAALFKLAGQSRKRVIYTHILRKPRSEITCFSLCFIIKNLTPQSVCPSESVWLSHGPVDHPRSSSIYKRCNGK